MRGHRAEPQLLEVGSSTPRQAGRRVADVPVDHVARRETGPAPYVGRRRAMVPTETAGHTTAAKNHPEGEVARILSALEPVDQTTSFAHEPTATLPMLPAEPQTAHGKRRAVKHAGGRGALFKGLPSAPVLLGIAALAVAVGGVVTVDDTAPAAGSESTRAASITHAASALGGASGQGTVVERGRDVSRDSARDAQADAAGQELKSVAEGLAEQRNSALASLADQAEERAQVIAQDLWQYPLDSVSLTARFGQYGLWSSYHTGLDFNGDTGDPIYSISNGEVISASYDGPYGNKTVIRLDDGTEIWYCHQTAYSISVGDTVRAGEVIGTVGTTGNVTGSHLHVEVRPGGGDPVDPYTAMQQHGLF